MDCSLTYSDYRKKKKIVIFLPKYLHISKKSSIFAADFNKISEVILPILKKKRASG